MHGFAPSNLDLIPYHSHDTQTHRRSRDNTDPEGALAASVQGVQHTAMDSSRVWDKAHTEAESSQGSPWDLVAVLSEY